MKKIILLLFLNSFYLFSQTGETVVVRDPAESYNLFQHAVMLEDAENRLSIEDILGGSYDSQFEPANGYIDLPAGGKGYWLRVKVRNEIDDFIYTFQSYVSTAKVDIYEVKDGRLVNFEHITKSGRDLPGEEFRQSILYAPLEMDKGEERELILYVQGVKLMYLPWFISSEQTFLRQLHRNDLFYGFVYGLFAIIVLYNLMLYFRLRENDYLLYAINMALVAFLLFNFHGHPYEFLWNGSKYLVNYLDVVTGLAGLAHVLFAMVFLRIKTFPRTLRWIFYVIIGKYLIDITAVIAGFANDFYPWFGSGNTAMFADIFIIAMGIVAALRGFFPAILFVVARLALVISVVITALYSIGQIDHTEFAYNALHVGASVEMILFALAISYKIRLLKVEKENAEREKAEYIKNQNIILEQRVKDRTQELQVEQEKSEALLLNILPKSIADELKINGHSEARRIPNVSVLFTDFKDFTHSARKAKAEDLIEELNHYFKKFDEITDRYGVEKIKTIGDAYMAAGGIPQSREDPARTALNTIRAAMEMQRFVEKNTAHGSKGILNHMRVGIHTGDVVAGVVGSKKFQYDIWGETVNLAARMENSGEIGRINISSSTYELVKEFISCEHRGQIHAKNVGKVDMYFVRSDAGSVVQSEKSAELK